MELAKGNWVGYATVFYHEKTGKYGTQINDVIDYSTLEIDHQGLAAYLDFGYSVFGHTPVKHVKYLLPYQSLRLENGKLTVVEGDDLTLAKLGKKSKEEDVFSFLEKDVNNWADGFKSDIIVPTSGGFDSRLLNFLIEDKSRIHAYTYGTSTNQNDSREAVYAKLLCQRLGIDWKRIDLSSFNHFEKDWYSIFGPSVGATGTYQMEFYTKIQKELGSQKPHLLSGIIGDAWAGSVHVSPILDAMDYLKLGYTHGMNANSKDAMDVDYLPLVEPIFDRQKDALKDDKFRVISAMRTKMMMLQYLIRVPETFGYEGYSPFINEDIAMSMLNLPEDRKQQRQWQRDFFRKNNILFEEEKHTFTYQNSLNFFSLLNERLNPLDSSLLKEYIKPTYLTWINQKITQIGTTERLYQTLMHTPKVKGVMKMMGFKNNLMNAYFAYLTLKPIERLLKIRENA